MPDGEQQEDRRDATRGGSGGMLTTMVAMWFDPATADAGRRPPRISTAALLAWTLVAIALTAGLAGINLLISGSVRPSWLVATLAMLVPLMAAFSWDPPRKVMGLSVGAIGGAAVGALAGYLVSSSVGSPFWVGFCGVAIGSLVTALSFGLITGRSRASGSTK